MDEYLANNGLDEGYRAPVQKFYDMSRDWYRGRAEEEWEPFTPQGAMTLWANHGFIGPFWALG